MSDQDNKSSPPVYVSSASGIGGGISGIPKSLQVILLAFDKSGERVNGQNQHAIIRFPQSYEDAIASVEHCLGPYLPNGRVDPELVDVLIPMYVNGGPQLMWATCEHKDWDTIAMGQLVSTRKALGLRMKGSDNPNRFVVRTPFVRGLIGLVYGEMGFGNATTWVDGKEMGKGDLRRKIDRPASYKEAMDRIKMSLYGYRTGWPQSAQTMLTFGPDSYDLKFYYFITDANGMQNTNLWVDFPPNAYISDEAWRAVVPQAGQILGFTMHSKK